ncbi:hypothetical protein [Ferrimonas sp. YFM]|uniref:tetratricopeptide repeat protein n=1 Tax=Ferrimonas sp. YFM TaxID=3028878 RepID=UPI0025722AF8|nr:hypothetical protein [Ferrimonas sp. YFM]BDY04803.1 hypothetical protein F0521_18440 [Ferrimonas sp. YFM]
MLFHASLLAFIVSGTYIPDNGTLSIPKGSEILSLSHKGEDGLWHHLQLEDGKAPQHQLTPGAYRFAASNSVSYGTFKGEFKVEAGKVYYLHQGLSGDRKRVFSWVSDSRPRSEKVKTEKLQYDCQSLGNLVFNEGQLDACRELARNKDGIGLDGLGRAYKEGLGVEVDENKAASYFKQAFDSGRIESSVSYYYIDTSVVDAQMAIKSAAESGYIWAEGAYANELAFGKSRNRDLAKEYAIKTAQQGNLDGLMIMSRIHAVFSDQGEDILGAAAWYRLNRFNSGGEDYFDNQLKVHIEGAIYEEDEGKITPLVKKLEQEHFSRSLKLIIATKSLLSVTGSAKTLVGFNNDYELLLSSDVPAYEVTFIDPYKEQNIDVTSNGDLVSYIKFQPYSVGDSLMCLFYNKESDEVEIVPAKEQPVCKPDEAVSVWSELKEVSF